MISLKEQLKYITEIVYTAPKFDSNYYFDANIDSNIKIQGNKSGRLLFYDFYAMEQLYITVGSGKYSKTQRDMQRQMSDEDPQKNFHQLNKPSTGPNDKGNTFSVGGGIVPTAMVKVVDDVFEQVTRILADRLVSYLHMAIIMEFRHINFHCQQWSQFCSKISNVLEDEKFIDGPNTNKHRLKWFMESVSTFLPEFKNHIHTVMKLLLYSSLTDHIETDSLKKYLNLLLKELNNSSTNTDKNDNSSNIDDKDVDLPSMPGDPDDTDYNSPDIEPNIGKYGGKGQPKAPYHYDASKINERGISTTHVKRVISQLSEARLTYPEIEFAYKNLDWSTSYGGEAWGKITEELINLIKARNNQLTEELPQIIDKIYDLDHNTGEVLNKGPLNVGKRTLDARYRITHIARYIPRVSSLVKQLIIRCLKYFPGEENELDKITKEKLPPQQMEINQSDLLYRMGFESFGKNIYNIEMDINNKKNKRIDSLYYITYKINDNNTEKYVLKDSLDSDLHIFNSFNDLINYINTNIIPNTIRKFDMAKSYNKNEEIVKYIDKTNLYGYLITNGVMYPKSNPDVSSKLLGLGLYIIDHSAVGSQFFTGTYIADSDTQKLDVFILEGDRIMVSGESFAQAFLFLNSNKAIEYLTGLNIVPDNPNSNAQLASAKSVMGSGTYNMEIPWLTENNKKELYDIILNNKDIYGIPNVVFSLRDIRVTYNSKIEYVIYKAENIFSLYNSKEMKSSYHKSIEETLNYLKDNYDNILNIPVEVALENNFPIKNIDYPTYLSIIHKNKNIELSSPQVYDLLHYGIKNIQHDPTKSGFNIDEYTDSKNQIIIRAYQLVEKDIYIISYYPNTIMITENWNMIMKVLKIKFPKLYNSKLDDNDINKALDTSKLYSLAKISNTFFTIDELTELINIIKKNIPKYGCPDITYDIVKSSKAASYNNTIAGIQIAYDVQLPYTIYIKRFSNMLSIEYGKVVINKTTMKDVLDALSNNFDLYIQNSTYMNKNNINESLISSINEKYFINDNYKKIIGYYF